MNLPNELITALLAAVPYTEVRGSIPLAVGLYKMTVFWAAVWSLVGAATASALLLWCLEPVVNFLSSHSRWFKNFFEKLFARTRSRSVERYLKWGEAALVIFVAVPLPGSGFWTGALIAFIFGLPKWRAWRLIFVGLLLTAIIVSLATLGVVKSLTI